MNNNKNNAVQVSKFVLFSISAGVIELGVFTLLTEVVKWKYWPCYLIALTLSVLWNFTFNRKFTFKDAGNIPKAMGLIVLFYLVFAPLSTIGGGALEKVGWNEYLVLGITMVFNVVLEFFYCKFVVYRKKTDDSVDISEEMPQ